MKKIVCLLTLVAFILTVQSKVCFILILCDECDRICTGVTRTCKYTFVVDYYETASDDCGACFTGTESDCYSPLCIPGDGTSRLVKGVNGTLPGPAIVVCVGDKLVINVVNKLANESTSIHWHGMHQVNTQSMDGVPMVTQYPIMPNETYTYRFTASEVGTHFWHSGSQRADGVVGPLIVRNNIYDSLPVTYDSDQHVVSLLDWPGTPTKSILVNGHGHDTVRKVVPPRRFNVDPGRSYRFRFIHAGDIMCPIEISIDNHQMQLFSMDGNDVVPRTVDAFTITNGERLDVVLRANKPITQYTMRFVGTLICNITGFATLHYSGAAQRSISYTSTRVLNSRVNCVRPDQKGCISYTQLKSYRLVPRKLLGSPGFIYYSTLDPFINEIAFRSPNDTLLCNSSQPTCEYDSRVAGQLRECTHVVTIPSNTLIELVLIGRQQNLLHSMHLHGHSFAVVGYRNYGKSVNSSLVANDFNSGILYSNINRPIIKDTVAVPDGGATVIRFISDNPGYWLLHGHGDHTEEGMQMVLRTSILPPKPTICNR